MIEKEYRVIHFDLSTRKLKKLYPGNPKLKELFIGNFRQMLVEQREKRKRVPIREVLAKAQKEADEYNAGLGIRPISKDDLEI